MQQSCNMQPRSHAALFQPQYRTHSSAPSLRLHFSATATPFDFFSCSPGLFSTRQPLLQCSRWCSTLPTLVPACRMARATMTAKRYHHQSKQIRPLSRARTTKRRTRTSTHLHASRIFSDTRSSPSCPNKLTVRVLGRAEKTKGKIRLLVHPSSFGEMAPSNLHGYPRALSDNYNTHTGIAYRGIGPDRPKIWTDIQ
jgi:hypothetical protein